MVERGIERGIGMGNTCMECISLIMHQSPNVLKLGMPAQPKTQLSSMLSSLILHDTSLSKKTSKVISFGTASEKKHY